MKLPNKGRSITLATLVLALGAAVYMNWTVAGQTPTTATASAETEEVAQTSASTNEAVPVIDPFGEGAASTTQDGKNYGEAQLVSANQDSSTEFFEQARLERTKSRDEALDSIKKALKNADMSDAEKQTLTQELETQVGNITAEADLERKIKAKGFADCVVTLGAGRADITVMTENDALTADEVTKIRDVILTSCRGLTAADITITEVK